MAKTRIGAAISLKVHIFPNLIYGYGAKWNIRAIKQLLEQIKADNKKLDQADKDVNIDDVLKSLKSFFTDSISLEDHIDQTDEDVFVLEFRALEILKKLHDAFNKVLQSSKLNPQVKEKLSDVIAHYKRLMTELEPKLIRMNQEMRHEKIGRNMVKYIMWQEWIAMFFQMKMRSNSLRRKSGRVKAAEHKIVHELDSLLKEPTQKDLKHIADNFDNKFAPAITKVITDAIFIERMAARLRDKLEDLSDKDKTKMNNLLSEGFPQEEIDKIKNKLVRKLDAKIKSDILKEYQEAREMVNLANKSNKLAA